MERLLVFGREVDRQVQILSDIKHAYSELVNEKIYITLSFSNRDLQTLQ